MAELIGAAVTDLAVAKLVAKVSGVIEYVIDLESNQKKLQQTMKLIKAALLDADSMSEQRSRVDQLKLEELSVLLDRWLDLSDVRASRVLQKQVLSGGNFTKEFRSFFSPSNQIVARIKDARKADGIKKKLSSIVIDPAMIGRICCKPPQERSIQRVRSSSILPTNFFVGRNKDREEVLSMLSEDSVASGTLYVASIVGIGGMGKTALAWSVYNDDRMEHCFDARFWVSVTQDFDVKEVLEEIISDAAGEMPLNIGDKRKQLYDHFQRAIGGKKFLLVLDNIWDQSDLRNKWFNLRQLLIEVGANGSKVLITTRDRKVAGVMDCGAPYMLGDLSGDDSWDLFKKIAFTTWQEPGVEAIGMEIVEMCPKVPLVIRSIAGHLSGKGTLQEWHALKRDQLANFASYGHDVMHTLKFSYDQLDAAQKLCVNYCSLFEKGGFFSEDEMIRRWIALEYVKPTYKTQSLEDAGKECMISLFNCGFLQSSSFGYFFSMHDVMYELLLTVAGFNYKVLESNTVEIDERVRHLSFWNAVMYFEDFEEGRWEVPSSLFKIKNLQSLVKGSGMFSWGASGINYKLKIMNLSMCGKLIPKFESLRVLDLGRVWIKELPTFVGDLICLRFLKLCEPAIAKLPNSITQLVNLQTLDLRCCDNLEKLPSDMSKLVNLRHLLLKGSKKLRHMPTGLGNLTNLRTLDTFIVGQPFESEASIIMGKLADLDRLDNLSGSLDIKLRRESKYITLSEISATKLQIKENLQELSISFKIGTKDDEWVLEYLQPPPNLQELIIHGYGGERLPGWMMDSLHNHVPSLKIIVIENCKSCKHLCSFGRLPHLKYLYLMGLDEVEYVEDVIGNDNNEIELSQAPLFPSLESLEVKRMPKLKGWWRMSSSEQEDLINVQVQHQHLVNWKPAFPVLYTLRVDSVELAIAIALQQIGGFTSLETLEISGSSIGEQSHQQQANTLPLSNCFPNLLHLQFLNLRLKVPPEGIQYLSSLQSLKLVDSENMKAIPEWIACLTSLQSLFLEWCSRLESLPHQIGNLPNLNTLDIHGCPKLKEKCQSPNGEYWPFIQHIPHLKIY